MKTEIAALAQASLDAYGEVLSPQYQHIREQLLGHLSVTGLDYDEMKMEAQSAHANEDLLQGFADILPLAEPQGLRSGMLGYGIPTQDPSIARMLLVTTVWSRPDDETMSTKRCQYVPPYYIVGQKPTDSERWTDILLLPASMKSAGDQKGQSSPRKLLVCTVKTKDLETKTIASNLSLYAQLTKEELATLFDEKSSKLIVSPDFKDVIKITSNPLARSQVRKKEPFTPNIEGYEGSNLLKAGISDRLLGEFDVPHHLNRLATMFGVVDGLKGLYEARAGVDTTTLREELNEGTEEAAPPDQ